MNDWVIVLCGYIVLAAGGALGWVKFFYEVRETRKQKQGRAKAEAELLLIRRRGQSPLFVPDDRRFEHFYKPDCQTGHTRGLHAGSAGLLCYLRSEVEFKNTAGQDDVVFVVKNIGEDALRLRVTVNGQPAAFIKESEIDDAHDLYALVYLHRPQQHGEEQIVSFWFQSRTGHEDTHLYRTRHGFRVLERIEPS